MPRSNGSLIGALNLPGDRSVTGGVFGLSDQQQFRGSSRWNVVYEPLTSIVANAAITVTYNDTASTSMNAFKNASANAWNASVRGTTGYTAPCTIEFNKFAAVSSDNGVSYAMIGWNEDPTTDENYISLDHASYPFRTDLYEVYNNGTYIGISMAWSPQRKFYVVYCSDGLIRHYNGSTLLYTSASYGTNKTVFLDSSLYSVAPTFGGFSNIRITRREWNGTLYL